eukprot:1154243-Pelagomonas_calceolata.AAC.7
MTGTSPPANVNMGKGRRGGEWQANMKKGRLNLQLAKDILLKRALPPGQQALVRSPASRPHCKESRPQWMHSPQHSWELWHWTAHMLGEAAGIWQLLATCEIRGGSWSGTGCKTMILACRT